MFPSHVSLYPRRLAGVNGDCEKVLKKSTSDLAYKLPGDWKSWQRLRSLRRLFATGLRRFRRGCLQFELPGGEPG